MSDADFVIPSIADVHAAAQQIGGTVRKTPLLNAPLLDAQLGGRVWLKAEPLQLTGSFKFRGAYNLISRLDAMAREAGVVAFSSGNHAQGVAAAASMVGTKASIVMPVDAPAIKLANTKAWGAEVITYPRSDVGARERIAAELLASRGGTLVRPFDDPLIIGGQGTVGLEAVSAAEALGLTYDLALIPCGGGGLSSGIALALHEAMPQSEIHIVEPDGYDDTAQSLAAGEIRHVDVSQPSLCDALLAPSPGEMTFTLLSQHLAGGLQVNDDEVKTAMRVAFEYFKLVIEPGGAVALAALLSNKVALNGRTALVVASGGNVDPSLFHAVLAQ